MKQILLFTDQTMLDRRVVSPCDYDTILADIRKQNGCNSGNKLFTYGVESLLFGNDISYEYYSAGMKADEINERFDLIVIPMANILNANPVVINELEWYSSFFEMIRIPTYIIGIGAQADSYDSIGELVDNIRVPAERFISAIYRTGGDFALRGYFTQEVFSRLGYKNVTVTGCPSLYQKGPNLRIPNEKVELRDFKATINGDLPYLKSQGVARWLRNSNVTFMDQNEMATILYSKADSDVGRYKWKDAVAEFTLEGIKCYIENRAKLFFDVPIWLDFFSKENISFSFGSRIHGNIAAILAGVPSLLLTRDSRTREMGEFYDIPSIESIPRNANLYELYLQTDYEAFNRNYIEKYHNFENFLVGKSIITHMPSDEEIEKNMKGKCFISPVTSGLYKEQLTRISRDPRSIAYSFMKDIAYRVKL